MLDICIEPTVVIGFYVMIRHGEEGLSTQVKLMRIVGITTDSHGDLSTMRQISNIILPKCKAGTELFYEFPTPETANIVTFEFVSNYGGNELCTPQIRLVK